MVLSWFWPGFALVSPRSCLVLAWIAVWLSFLLLGVVFVCLSICFLRLCVSFFVHHLFGALFVYIYIGTYIVVLVSGCFPFAGPFRG